MKYNVAIIIESLTGGGAERIAGLLSSYLSKRCKVFLFVCDDKNITYEYSGTIVKLRNGSLYEEIFNAKKQYSIDCAISFSESMNYANIRTKINEVTIVSQRNSTYIKSKRIPMIKKYYSYADVVIACSEGCKKLLIDNAGIDHFRVRTIYNFINERKQHFNVIDKDTKEKILKGEYILSVGRLTWEKNQRNLIRQFVYYKQRNRSSIRLVIIGSGKLEDELRKEIEINNAKNYIDIIPYTENVGLFYQHAKAFVLSSCTEGFPNVLLDALSYKLPIISTDCISGPREILNDETDYTRATNGIRIAKRGILVQTEELVNSSSGYYIAKALDMLLSDKRLIIKLQKAAEVYTNQYSNQRIIEEWENTIQFFTQNRNLKKLDETEYESSLETADIIIIYGAGKYGRYAANNKKYRTKKIIFAVSENNGNDHIDDIPVYQIDELIEYRNRSIVLVASYYENNIYEMMYKAYELGFEKVFLAEI